MTELVRSNTALAKRVEYDEEKRGLLKNTIARGTTNEEFELFIAVCQHTGLDPFLKQVYPVMRWNAEAKKNVMVIQTGIDGYRLIAERTRKYAGQTAPQWCGADGAWKDVWLEDGPPAAARVGVFRRGFRDPVWGVVRFKAYCQRKSGGEPNHMWATFGAEQLAKCAEALALRKAFPNELSGMRAMDEMAVEDGETATVHYQGTRAAAAEKSQAALSEASVVEDPPPTESGPAGDGASQSVTLEALMELVKRGKAQLKRSFTKESPPGSGSIYFIDQKILTESGIGKALMIEKEGEQFAHPDDLAKLFTPLLRELEQAAQRAA